MQNKNLIDYRISSSLMRELDNCIVNQNDLKRNLNKSKVLDIGLMTVFDSNATVKEFDYFLNHYVNPPETERTTFTIKNPSNHELLKSYKMFDKKKVVEFVLMVMIDYLNGIGSDAELYSRLMQKYYLNGGVGL